MSFISSFFILACFCVYNVWGAIGTSQINCEIGSEVHLGSVEEEYEGDVEIITNVNPSDELKLDAYIFQSGVTFLELIRGETTATVRTTKPLDADGALKESGGKLYYSVTCANVRNIRTLDLVDINDNAPVFEKKEYITSVSEIIQVGSDALKVKAVDADVTAQYSTVYYSIQPPVPAEFELRGDGTIRLLRRLNYNIANLYTFTVEAKDIDDQKDTATVIINVEDFDNLNPYFDHSLYQASFPENQEGQISAVAPTAIKAQDGDTGINEPVVYSITVVDPNELLSNFNIDPNSGVISVTTALDREETERITIQIQAAQQDDSTKTGNAVVFLAVEDENDNPPEFDQSEYTTVIPENSPNDMVVLQAKVTDLDQGGFVGTLQVIPDTVPFSITPDGFIRVKSSAELDRETTSTFTFQIEAKDSPPSNFSALATVNVSLSDENDNTPVFGKSKYEGKVFINQTVGLFVVKVEATDLDEGPNGQVSYFIDFGNDEGHFAIDENTGEITLIQVINLPDNEILQFSLYVRAKDGGTVSRSSSVLVDIKAPGESHPQFFEKVYQGKVEEEQEAGAEIVKVNFFSVDTFVPVTLTVETEADKFSIDESSRMLKTRAKLDYETQKNYTVQLSITDGTKRDTAVVHVEVIDINDNSPEFAPIPSSIEIPEDAEIGDKVTTILATDADAGLNAEVRYSLEGSAGMFSVNPDTGLVMVAAALDRETQSKYNFSVVAQDQGRPILSAEASLIITITDVNDNAPIFSKQQYEAIVWENATIGTDVIGVNATDKDEGLNAVVSYHISKQEPPSPAAAFTIESTTGTISLAQKLDYSKAKRYTLEVEGKDGGSPSLTGSTVVIIWVQDVNDKAPEFSQDQYDVAVYENIAPGSALLSLEVTDEDEGGFSNGYFILTSDIFSVNSQGVIHLQSHASLDRETRDNYIIQVVAVDQPVDGLSSTAQINITVLDVNDNNPQFIDLENPQMIPEDQTGEVYHIQVSDADIEENGMVTLTPYSYNELFIISTEGTLTVTGNLDRETQDVYELVIVATDHGEPPRNNVTTLTIIVTDVNDNDPIFTEELYSARVLAKDVKKGDVVLTVSATDLDAGNNSLISYRFSSEPEMLDLHPDTGVITWTRDLTDITEDTELELTVIAEDHGSPPRNSTAKVLIEIKAASLTEDLAFENSTYHFSVKENEPVETEVGVVKALTGSQLVQVTYILTSHSDLFSVDESGTIKTLQSLDKEEQEWYFIKVQATDSRTPPSTAVTMVVLQVEDVNEPPVFDSEKYEAEVFSIAPFRFPVVAVKATDPDVGDTEELQYSLEESSPLLAVESSSGQVYVMDLTGMGGKVITVQVKATDRHGLFTTAELQVTVKNSGSDNIVVIALNQPVHTVQEKIRETQNSLEKVLGWSVNILSLRVESVSEMRSLLRETTAKTYISFIATDKDGTIISAKEVNEKLRSEQESVKVELEIVFGPGLEVEQELEGGSGSSQQSNEAVVIALGVLLALSLVGLIVLVVVTVLKFKKMTDTDSDKESFNIGKRDISDVFTNEVVFTETQDDQGSYKGSRKTSDVAAF
ncbi:hypothetical protein AOLI_G00236660 [Acnodon oligacanthus]